MLIKIGGAGVTPTNWKDDKTKNILDETGETWNDHYRFNEPQDQVYMMNSFPVPSYAPDSFFAAGVYNSFQEV